MILSILDIKKEGIFYLVFTLFIVIFSSIYESFSHGVMSIFMITAFIYPLIGLITNLFLIKKKIEVPTISSNLLLASLLTLCFGSIIKGVLDIYGTTNQLVYIYPVIGIILLLISLFSFVFLLPNEKD